MRVLVVEDNEVLAASMCDGLGARGPGADVAGTLAGAEGARAILDATHRLDAALIDIIAAWREGERDGEGRSEPDAYSRG